MRIALVCVLAVFSAALVLAPGIKSAPAPGTATPVLVELFTSEGCSTCPPADRFLQKLDEQPIAGAYFIVLSEHVDYWNHDGWRDPYSAHSYSERQDGYAKRFGLNGVYTPQIVVDGTSEFVGTDAGKADKAITKAVSTPKIPVHLSSVTADQPNALRVHLEIGTLDASFASREAEVFVAVALNRAESQVSAGENAGHKLQHVAVVKSLTKAGTLKQGQSLAQDVQLKLERGSDLRNLRLIAFVQESRQGRVLGAAAVPVSTQ